MIYFNICTYFFSIIYLADYFHAFKTRFFFIHICHSNQFSVNGYNTDNIRLLFEIVHFFNRCEDISWRSNIVRWYDLCILIKIHHCSYEYNYQWSIFHSLKFNYLLWSEFQLFGSISFEFIFQYGSLREMSNKLMKIYTIHIFRLTFYWKN